MSMSALLLASVSSSYQAGGGGGVPSGDPLQVDTHRAYVITQRLPTDQMAVDKQRFYVVIEVP